MLTVGIDSASRVTSAALLRDDELLGMRSADAKHSAVLLPMIDELLRSQGVECSEIDLFAVAQGPGTYTGLRVGVVTAKCLGRATGAKVLGVPTMEAMAHHSPSALTQILVVLRGYKRRVVMGAFDRHGGEGPVQTEAPQLVSIDDVPLDRPEVSLVTDLEDLALGYRGPATVVSGPEAHMVARLALERHNAGAEDQKLSIVPEYIKPPSITLPKKVKGKKGVAR